MKHLIERSLQESIKAKKSVFEGQAEVIVALADKMTETVRNGGKIMVFGNGGSAADAQHFAAEFVNRFLLDRPPLAAIALSTDTSIITSIGNDFSFDDIFSKQIQALGREGDLALGISTSGTSPNVVKAIDTAIDIGIYTAALTGATGGVLASKADLILTVPSSSTPAIQEAHIWIEHVLCEIVEQNLFS